VKAEKPKLKVGTCPFHGPSQAPSRAIHEGHEHTDTPLFSAKSAFTC